MLGAIVNCAAVLAGGFLGLLIKKGISEKIGNNIMSGLALCVLYIGISGTLTGEKILVVILSVAIGALLGEWLDLDKRINQLGKKLEEKFNTNDNDMSISHAFVTSSLLFCVGAMAVVGSLQSGLSGNHETLFAKSLIDGISAIILASSMGIGVLFSGALVLIYEGGLTLCASILSPFLSTPVVNEINCVGSLIIIGLALNMLKITNLKIMNLLPAVFIPIILCMFI